MSRNKNRVGVVYSTNPDYQYETENESIVETLSPSKQRLIVKIDRRSRGGKQVTLIDGFIGTEEDLSELAKIIKNKCGVGGSSKDGQILIQGDFRDKIVELLKSKGYNTKRGN